MNADQPVRRTGTAPSASPARAAVRLRVLLMVLGAALVAGVLALSWTRWSEARLRSARVDELLAITAREPNNALAHYYLGLARRKAGQEDAAVESFRSASRADPRHRQSHEALVTELLSLGRNGEAFVELARMRRELPDSAFVHLTLGKRAAEGGDTSTAAREFRLATELGPRQWEPWYRLGLILGQLHQFPDARSALERARKLEPRNVDVLTALGFLEFDTGRSDEALRWLRQALSVDPNHPEANRYLAEVLYVRPGPRAQLEEARACLQRALRVMPEFGEAYFWLAQVSFRLGDTAAGIRALEHALSLDPNDPGALQLLGQTYLRARRRQEGEALLARFRKASEFKTLMNSLQLRARQEPGRADLHFRIARLFGEAGRWRRAVEEYERGLQLEPANAAARQELAAAQREAQEQRRDVDPAGLAGSPR